MRPDSEQFSFGEEVAEGGGRGSEKEEKEEKEGKEEKEPWSEQFECGGNQIQVHFTGKKEREAERDKNLWEIDRLELTTPEGQKLDFSSLLPKGWRFKRIEGYTPEFYMAASYYQKNIIIPEFHRETESRWVDEEEPLPSPYQEERRGREIRPWGEIIDWEDVPTFTRTEATIGLLHEIGHAHQRRIQKGERMRERIEELGKETGKEGRPTLPLTRREIGLYCQYVIMIERNAWAYALREYRKLKNKGINILPKITSNQQILEIVNRKVKTYIEGVIYHAQFKALKKELVKRKNPITQKILGEVKRLLGLDSAQGKPKVKG